MTRILRDHGGGLDRAVARYGGTRVDWIDLSTGINPAPFPVSGFDVRDWTDLPDSAAQTALVDAARRFWDVPEEAAILCAPGASSLIARLPALFPAGDVDIPSPTYNEHAAAFAAHGWAIASGADTKVLVHPNNPDGRCWSPAALGAVTIVDESFCDVMPEASLMAFAARKNTVILKSFGKFWGLAGLRLGFAIGDPALIARLAEFIGPWAVSGPALRIGTQALSDTAWAETTRRRLEEDARRLDSIVQGAGAKGAGGTSLFRLYEVGDSAVWQDRLARHHIWSRIFPYSRSWLRLGLPSASGWDRIEHALS